MSGYRISTEDVVSYASTMRIHRRGFCQAYIRRWSDTGSIPLFTYPGPPWSCPMISWIASHQLRRRATETFYFHFPALVPTHYGERCLVGLKENQKLIK
jgi:hypothetical protein